MVRNNPDFSVRVRHSNAQLALFRRAAMLHRREHDNAQRWQLHCTQATDTIAAVIPFALVGGGAGFFFQHPAVGVGMIAVGAIAQWVYSEWFCGLNRCSWFFAWDRQPKSVICPWCDEAINVHTKWLCRSCRHRHGGSNSRSFLCPCVTCGSLPDGVACPYCRSVIPLTDEEPQHIADMKLERNDQHDQRAITKRTRTLALPSRTRAHSIPRTRFASWKPSRFSTRSSRGEPDTRW